MAAFLFLPNLSLDEVFQPILASVIGSVLKLMRHLIAWGRMSFRSTQNLKSMTNCFELGYRFPRLVLLSQYFTARVA